MGMHKTGFFELQTSFKVDYAPAAVKKWRSSRTGLQLTWVDQKSPIVNGYFAVGTEITNDSGCPHTLEHLVFMGSNKYPYKGLLDTLGNLAYSVTNAWTATDQTVYTLVTAGWEGFRMLLPVYLDHVLFPKITDSACYTEVYHVGADAEDKGVVYSEMQGIENQSYFVEGLAAQRALYKETSGYRSETGGLTKNLRVLKNDTIRQYHANNYRPDNLCVIVSGSVDEAELLEVMAEFDSQLQPLPAVPSKRPFVDSPADLPPKKALRRNVEFPDEDESASEIQFSWIGPDGKDIVLEQAIDILGKYFTSSSVSLFSKNLIEIDHPLATSSSFYADSYVRTGLNLTFSNVPTEEADQLPQKVEQLLKDHCNADQLDLARLRDLTAQSKRKFVFASEKSPESIINMAIFEFSYGNQDGSDLQLWLKTLREYDEILKWDIGQWLKVYKEYFLDNNPVVVVAKPSFKLYNSLKEEHDTLIADRKAKLGEKGLKELEKRLENAQAENDRPIPKHILDSFGQPDPSHINFIHTTSVAAGLNNDITNDPSSEVVKRVLQDAPKDLPLYVHVEDVESHFATMHLFFSSYEIDEQYLPYLPIFKEFLSLPMEAEDGSLVPYDAVIKQLKRDTVSYGFTSSFHDKFSELLDFRITVPASNYEKGIDWFYKLMFKTKFTKDRVFVSLNRLVKSIPEIKRSGTDMLTTIINKTCFTDRSIRKACDVYQKEEFFKAMLTRLKNGDDKDFAEVEKCLNAIRHSIFKLENMRTLLVLDSSKIKRPIVPWAEFAQKVGGSSPPASTPLIPLPITSKAISKDGFDKRKKCVIMTTPGSDSSYMSLQTNIPFKYSGDDVAKIILGCEFLQCVEGPFWKAIRGTGLAYGANVGKSYETGKLAFSIYRGADVGKCFEEGRKLVQEYADGTRPVEEKMLQGAISAVVNGIAYSESNYFAAAERQFYDQVLVGRGSDFNTELMKALKRISCEDLVEIFNKYFTNMFDPEHSICFISCNPSNAESISGHFEKAGYEVTVEEASVGASSEGSVDGSVNGTESEDDDDDSE